VSPLVVFKPRCAVVTDSLQHNQPLQPKPNYLQAYVDPTYKTTVRRITGDVGAAIPTVGGTWGTVSRHNYSKDPVWNADQSRMVLKVVNGVTGILILDGATYEPLFTRTVPSAEFRWHPSLPTVMIYMLASTGETGHWNPTTDSYSAIYTPTGYNSVSMGPFEGNPSNDARWVVANANRISDSKRVAFTIDLLQATKSADLEFVANGVTSIDWASASPSGELIVVNGTITGGDATDATKVFTRAGSLVQFWTEFGRPSHYDLAFDTGGHEVAVGVSKSAPDEGKVIMRRLTDGTVTVLDAGGYASHTSTRNSQRSGWAYVSHSYNGPDWPPFRDELFAVRLDGSGSIERIANLHGTNAGDTSAPVCVPSPDGKRVIFASNWENGAGAVQAYIADVRAICP
jgi:hypothetical protein